MTKIDLNFADEDFEVSLARRRAAALEAFVVLHKLNKDDEMFWRLTDEQRRRICRRFDEASFDRMLSRMADEYERDPEG